MYYKHFKDRWELVWEYAHNFGFAPVFRLGGIIKGKHDGGTDASTPIERIEQLDGKLILQGADDGSSNTPDGAGWTMVINVNSGSMLLTATGDGFVVVVSGACMIDS